MSFRYIGSKARVALAIVDEIGPPTSGSRFVDGFCGTGAVSSMALSRGWRRFLINDTLLSAGLIAAARLTSQSDAPFLVAGGYESILGHLNSIPGSEGFVARTYSPLSSESCEVERRYFTVENAARIDAIRLEIERLLRTETITRTEYRLLIADLLLASNRIANTAGTYGCFLRDWTEIALRPIHLQPQKLSSDRTTVEIQIGDVEGMSSKSSDVVYLDPPYTKRQYAAYYHILETVAYGDNPDVSGVTGLRPWRSKASKYCYSRLAQAAITNLLLSLEARQIYMSYSTDGFVNLDELLETLIAKGERAELRSIREIGRYRPNEKAGRRKVVEEWLLTIDRT
jgi:adenine-specific DNA-methyltransferase